MVPTMTFHSCAPSHGRCSSPIPRSFSVARRGRYSNGQWRTAMAGCPPVAPQNSLSRAALCSTNSRSKQVVIPSLLRSWPILRPPIVPSSRPLQKPEQTPRCCYSPMHQRRQRWLNWSRLPRRSCDGVGSSRRSIEHSLHARRTLSMPEVEIPNPEELEEIRNKGFTRRVAITTALYAVMLAIAALGGNNAMKDMLLAQQQSSDQWAFYQAKVIREHEYRIQQKRLEVELAERGAGMAPETRQQYEALLAEFTAETKRYGAEKKDIEQDAKKLEHERDVNRKKDPYFDFAEVLLQIAIVMSSVSILATSRLLYGVSFVLAVCGTLLMLNGYALVVALPFFSGGH